jgi:Fe-S cluster assembly ATP-binding protein
MNDERLFGADVKMQRSTINYQLTTINNNTMLEIKDLHVSIDGREILKGINLEVKAGEVHAIMGPNGSGKSTLAAALAGKDSFEITRGSILFMGENLIGMKPEDRARKGLFLGFQYPVEIPGVSIVNFMKTAINEQRKFRGLDPISASDFLKKMREKKELVGLTTNLANRSVNEGFSGGEKKKNEIFQMAMLEPLLAILDETDSGLDIDALKTVATGVNKLRRKDNATIVITHYQRLLEHIIPDFVHVLYKGRIVKSSGKELALELEEKGYEWMEQEAE